jgi:hypothetical protein
MWPLIILKKESKKIYTCHCILFESRFYFKSLKDDESLLILNLMIKIKYIIFLFIFQIFVKTLN